MKITMLSVFYPYRGGIAQCNASLYRALDKEHDVDAITFKRQYPDFLFPGETQYVAEKDVADKIPATRLLDTINPFSYCKTARKIKKSQPELLLTRYWMTFFAPSLGTISKKMAGKAIRISILDNVIPHEKRFFDKPCNRFFLKHNDGFVVMSDSVLADLLSIRPDAKYLRINHPVFDHFGAAVPRELACERLQLDAKKKNILFFGIIRDYKGLDVLIEAMNGLSDEYHLIIAGEVYGSFQSYQDQIDALGLSNRISLFNHYISDDMVPNFFCAADICVLPYKSATQSGVTAIAFHFEVPVIATDVGGLKETIVHEETGLIVEKPNSDLLRNAINRYFDETLSMRFKQNIRKFSEVNSWKNFAEKLLVFANEIRNSVKLK